jgi:hypothetical protein
MNDYRKKLGSVNSHDWRMPYKKVKVLYDTPYSNSRAGTRTFTADPNTRPNTEYQLAPEWVLTISNSHKSHRTRPRSPPMIPEPKVRGTRMYKDGRVPGVAVSVSETVMVRGDFDKET